MSCVACAKSREERLAARNAKAAAEREAAESEAEEIEEIPEDDDGCEFC